MGTVTDKLSKVLETKSAIKNAIVNKGVDVTEKQGNARQDNDAADGFTGDLAITNLTHEFAQHHGRQHRAFMGEMIADIGYLGDDLPKMVSLVNEYISQIAIGDQYQRQHHAESRESVEQEENEFYEGADMETVMLFFIIGHLFRP